MEKLSIAICDDEIIFGKKLENVISTYFNKKQLPFEIDLFQSGKEFVNLKDKMAKYHIVFLDINMKDMDGIETARNLRYMCKDTFVVFVTAFINYTLEGYKVDAIRYILKMDSNFEKSVNECLDAICEKMNYQSRFEIFHFQEGIRKVSVRKIVYIESDLHKLNFYILEDKLCTYTMYETLNNIVGLFEKDFVRIHQSYLVNLSYILKMNRCDLILSGGTILPIARAREKEVKKKFAIYKGEM